MGGATCAVLLPPAKAKSVFCSNPLPVWPLKAWWFKTVSLADPGAMPRSKEGRSPWGRQGARCHFQLLPGPPCHRPHQAQLPPRIVCVNLCPGTLSHACLLLFKLSLQEVSNGVSGSMLVTLDLTVSSFWGLEFKVDSSTTLQLLNGVLTLRAGSPREWG